MPQIQPGDKLEQFRQVILEKANAEKAKILRETEEQKKQELEREKSRQLDEIYRKMQEEIAAIRAGLSKAVAKERTRLKRQLYRQREQYLSELIARARVELVAFTRTEGYTAYLCEKLENLSKNYPPQKKYVLRMRTDDLAQQALWRSHYGECGFEADDEEITIGGVILYDRENGVAVNESLDRALEEQRAWFCASSGLFLE